MSTVCADAVEPVASGEAGAAQSVAAALRATKPIVDLRLRSEQVEQDGLPEDADALTLRGRLGFETGKAWNWALLAEAELLWPLVTDYNSTVNGKTQFPIVADPESYEVNRLAVVNTSLPGTTLTFGRQAMLQDNQRFVSPADWRQNEQSFDAVRVLIQSVKNLTIDLSYVNQVNRVFGKESPVGRYTGDNYLANIAYQMPVGRIVGFAYLLDFEQAPTDSSTTFGVRYSAEWTLSEVKLAGAAGLARQEDRGNNPLSFSDDYLAAELNATVQHWSLGVGIEVLQGDGVKGFSTPLATLHKFQGWADKFTTTPADGVDDRYVTLGYARKPVGRIDSVSASAVYHRFEAERVSADFGSEIDLLAQAKWKRWSATLKYADYRADGFATDTRKFWAQVDYVY
jgi:hypothetical protein